jgi:hypothetical protein
MRTFGGILLGLLLFFPGIELLRWLTVKVLGAYDAVTLTDGCLAMIMVLLCVHLVRSRPGRTAERRRRPERDFDEVGEAQLHYLPGQEQRRPSRRRTTSSRRSSRRD